jgi:chromate transport protein ChrA
MLIIIVSKFFKFSRRALRARKNLSFMPYLIVDVVKFSFLYVNASRFFMCVYICIMYYAFNFINMN